MISSSELGVLGDLGMDPTNIADLRTEMGAVKWSIGAWLNGLGAASDAQRLIVLQAVVGAQPGGDRLIQQRAIGLFAGLITLPDDADAATLFADLSRLKDLLGLLQGLKPDSPAVRAGRAALASSPLPTAATIAASPYKWLWFGGATAVALFGLYVALKKRA
jgi:hypothetical protein